MERTNAQKLASTLRWCAEEGEVRGLHPAMVREAANLLEQQEAELAAANEALAANDHLVRISISEEPGYRLTVAARYVITSPKVYEAKMSIDTIRLELGDRDFITNSVARSLTGNATREWMNDLQEKTARELWRVVQNNHPASATSG